MTLGPYFEVRQPQHLEQRPPHHGPVPIIGSTREVILDEYELPMMEGTRIGDLAPHYSTDTVQWALSSSLELGLSNATFDLHSDRMPNPARISRQIAHVVAGEKPVESLFEDGVIPGKAVFEKIIQQARGGEIGVMLSTLLMDSAYPYQKQPDDGYIELPATDPDNAFKLELGGKKTEYTAHFCSYAEPDFWRLYNDPDFSESSERIDGAPNIPVLHDGTLVADEKVAFNPTALLRKPAIINGVRIPAGSMIIVSRLSRSDGGQSFAFGRLTPFTLADADEAVRQFPGTFEGKFLSDKDFRAGGAPSAFRTALRRFSDLAGRPSPPSAEELVRNYQAEHPEYADQPDMAALRMLRMLDEELAQPEYRRFVLGFATERDLSVKAAKAAQSDYKIIRETYAAKGVVEDPSTRGKLISDAQTLRHLYYRFFGPRRVKYAQHLIDQRDNIARLLNSSSNR